MTSFFGANTEDLRSLSVDLSDRSQHLMEIGERLLAAVQVVSWVGPDADAFRAECTAVVGDLSSCAADVADRSRDLDVEAEQQDQASAADGSSGGGAGGGGRGPGASDPRELLPDISPWFREKPSTFGERLRDVGEDVAKSKLWKEAGDAFGHTLRTLGSSRYWANFGRKAVPAIPDLYDAYGHATRGETKEFTFAMARAVYDFHPIIGPVETASGIGLPLVPDSWKFPGTDKSINEGSLFDHLEDAVVADDADHRFNRALHEGEQDGLDISERLGIEHEPTRNVFKTIGGASNWIGEGQRDEHGNAWVITGLPEGRRTR